MFLDRQVCIHCLRSSKHPEKRKLLEVLEECSEETWAGFTCPFVTEWPSGACFGFYVPECEKKFWSNVCPFCKDVTLNKIGKAYNNLTSPPKSCPFYLEHIMKCAYAK